MKNLTASEKSLKLENKDSKHATQLRIIFDYLQNNIATASMVTDATGVPQKCVTRYKRNLQKLGKLIEVRKTHCKLTGFRASYLSTNTDLINATNPQLNLFAL